MTPMLDVPLEQNCRCTIEGAESGKTIIGKQEYITVHLRISTGPDIGRKLFARFYNKSKLRHLGLPDDPDNFGPIIGRQVEVVVRNEEGPNRIYAVPYIKELLPRQTLQTKLSIANRYPYRGSSTPLTSPSHNATPKTTGDTSMDDKLYERIYEALIEAAESSGLSPAQIEEVVKECLVKSDWREFSTKES